MHEKLVERRVNGRYYVALMPLAGGQGPPVIWGYSQPYSNQVPADGADYAHHITACPPGFENLTTSLQCT